MGRRIMVEVTDEELKRLEGGFAPTLDDVIDFLMKSADKITSVYRDPATLKDSKSFSGTLKNEKVMLDFTIIEK